MRRLSASLLAGMLLLTGCGDEKGQDFGAAVQKRGKPQVTVPSGPPPTTLQIEDLETTTGPEAKVGDRVEVHYVGVSYSTGKEFDASWKSGRAFPFTIGQGQVIKGWDQGVAGMRVGGRRRLVIPPDLAYGARGYPPVIQPNETLVFVVDLVDIVSDR